MRQTREAFPAGLYGMLLIAVFGLTLPSLFAPVERVLVGAAALVPRLLGVWSGTPVAAAEPAVIERLHVLRDQLAARVLHHDVHGAAALMPAQWLPVVCGVVAAERRGGGGEPSLLQLDRTHAELVDAVDFVTKGDALIGVLLRPGQAGAVHDGPHDLARVALLNDASSRSVAAAMAFAAGGSLRMIVGPAARVDVASLRAELWDDPYRASALRGGGHAVHTLSITGLDDEPPAGLLLGRTLVWGYPGLPMDDPLTIGVFIEPPVEPRALSHVVLWRQVDGVLRDLDVPEPPLREQHAAVVWDLPGASGRFLLASAADLADGAAVVQDGLCLGTIKDLAFGLALVTSFSASRHRWSLLLLPEDDGARPRELVGEVIAGRPGLATVHYKADTLGSAGDRLPAGYLFTGSNGPHCPAGLLLGSARPVPGEMDLLEVTLPGAEGPRAAMVITARTRP